MYQRDKKEFIMIPYNQMTGKFVSIIIGFWIDSNEIPLYTKFKGLSLMKNVVVPLAIFLSGSHGWKLLVHDWHYLLQ